MSTVKTINWLSAAGSVHKVDEYMVRTVETVKWLGSVETVHKVVESDSQSG